MKTGTWLTPLLLAIVLPLVGCEESTVDSEVESEWRSDEVPDPSNRLDVEIHRDTNTQPPGSTPQRGERLREAIDDVDVEVHEEGVKIDVE